MVIRALQLRDPISSRILNLHDQVQILHQLESYSKLPHAVGYRAIKVVLDYEFSMSDLPTVTYIFSSNHWLKVSFVIDLMNFIGPNSITEQLIHQVFVNILPQIIHVQHLRLHLNFTDLLFQTFIQHLGSYVNLSYLYLSNLVYNQVNDLYDCLKSIPVTYLRLVYTSNPLDALINLHQTRVQTFELTCLNWYGFDIGDKSWYHPSELEKTEYESRLQRNTKLHNFDVRVIDVLDILAYSKRILCQTEYVSPYLQRNRMGWQPKNHHLYHIKDQTLIFNFMLIDLQLRLPLEIIFLIFQLVY